MAEYEIEWTETHKMYARLSAPPNDQRILDAAKENVDFDDTSMPRVVMWASIDGEAQPVLEENGKRQVSYNITTISRVEQKEVRLL